MADKLPPQDPAAAVVKKAVDHFYRFAEVDAATASDEDMTVQVAFSSEALVLRRAKQYEEDLGIAKKGTRYYEILSHDADHADFSELNRSGAPILDEHDDKAHLGNVTRARLSDDRRGRAVLKFDGITELSKSRFQQMRSGSRPFVSVGYFITGLAGDAGEKNGIPVKRVKWASDEISSVARPADVTASARRSASDQWSCLGCGEEFTRSKLNSEYECPDCETIATRRKVVVDFAAKLAPAEQGHKYRAKGKAQEFTHSELRTAIAVAADADKRFKTKLDNGNVYSNFYVYDVAQDGEDLWALIVGPDCKMWEVEVTFDGVVAELGDAEEVVRVESFEPVGRKSTRGSKRREVDSQNLPEITATAKTTNQTRTENMETIDEKQVRRSEREVVVAEFGAKTAKRAARAKEINALADEAITSRGRRWNGKPGAVFECSERVRKAQLEALDAPEDHDLAEVRTDFKRSLAEIYEGSREPKLQEDVASLEDTLAKRCSLGRLMREATKAMDKNDRQACWTVKDGAEYEADKEIRHRANEFPGGAESLEAGIQLPWNMNSRVRSSTPVGRMGRDHSQRDALAGDFASAGALISPDYQFPMIELLRNFPALARAGMTILSGAMGPLVLPRQEAATTAQSVAEGAQLQPYDQVLGQIKMSPHRVGSTQNYSRLATIQVTPDFEAMVMADHMAVIALKIDSLGLTGQGAGDEPLGVLNQLIQSIGFGGSAANAYKNVVAMETLVRKANISEPGSYISTSAVRGMLRTVALLLIGATTVAANPIWTDGETVNGRSAWDSQQVPGDVMLYGVFRHLVMAQWGGLAVVLDTLTRADRDQIKLSTNTYVDFALRHNQAFCRTSDSLAALS